ncbi:MAG: hypothetical protein HY699_23595 [Deltaproteobacteria bacterium]|nr:hypothetical protein [Deltaproteobacteria bacterium]
MRCKIVAAMLLASLLLAGRASAAKLEAGGENYGQDAAYGSLAVLSNLLYMPFKVVYATLGGMTGGLAYVLTVGNLEVAEAVWSPSLGGTYVVTPAMLHGEEEFLFSGPSRDSK